jgi:hypothetical protein
MFGPAGDLHVMLLSAAAFATLLMSAMKLDDRFANSWWTVMSPLIASFVTSLYIYLVTVVRLRMDSHSRYTQGYGALHTPTSFFLFPFS